MHAAYHHVIRRKKRQNKTEEHTKLKVFLDGLVYVSAIGGALMNIPQLMTIWIDKNITGVSIITWVGFLMGSSFWMLYGIVHKERPVIITNGLYVIIQLLIVIGLGMYGARFSFY